MGVVISKPAINLREQLTELKAQQGYEEQQFHFDNLVTNGTFDTDTTGWTDATDGRSTASLASNKMRITNDVSGYGYAYQTISLEVGKTYTASWDVSAPGTLYSTRVFWGNAEGTITKGDGSTAAAVTGTQSVTFVAEVETIYFHVQIFVTSFGPTIQMDFDNISVYEVDPADDKVIHTMPKGWKPLHVFEDGALQREGSAYDYTVEYDGFNYIVKETVAPVAPYSTTVIGVRA